MSDSIKTALKADMKEAMKAKDSVKLGTIRLVMSAIKQREVDERIELQDADILQVLDKMSKQRRDSIKQFEEADRTDLADKESAELGIIQSYLPEPLSSEEIAGLVTTAIAEVAASSVKDMGKVMQVLKPQLQGRADVASVSGQVKEQLAKL